MWPFKKDVVTAPVANLAFRDFKGEEIWRILEAGLRVHGMEMRRNGTANLGFEKWGDGKYHFKCEVDEIVPEITNIGMMIDGLPYKKDAWNLLTTSEKQVMCRDHIVRFVLVADGGDVDAVEGNDPNKTVE